MTEAEPATIVGLWPGDEPPTRTEVLAGLAGSAGFDESSVEELQPQDSMLWAFTQNDVLPNGLIIWAEPAQNVGPEDVPDPEFLQNKWILGASTILPPDASYETMVGLVRLLAGSFPDVPAIIDTNTGMWILRADLDELFLADQPCPPEDLLWRVHVVSTVESIEEADQLWLYTTGLHRCWRPELELIGIPGPLLQPGLELIGGIASRILLDPLPEPGKVEKIGHEIDVCFQPWQVIADSLEGNQLGTEEDRANFNGGSPLEGVRAVICDPVPTGVYRKSWTWPKLALERIDRGEGAVYMTEHATQLLSRLAQQTWYRFATAFINMRDWIASRNQRNEDQPEVIFLVKAAFDTDTAEHREHLWFQIDAVEGDHASGVLLHSPLSVKSVQENSRARLDLPQVTDWRVWLGGVPYSPSSAKAMMHAVDRIREQPDE